MEMYSNITEYFRVDIRTSNDTTIILQGIQNCNCKQSLNTVTVIKVKN